MSNSNDTSVRKTVIFTIMLLLTCASCTFRQQKSPTTDSAAKDTFAIKRFDRLEIKFLTTGDFSALHDMSTTYPTQTRNLIEEVLRIGRVDAPDITTRFIQYFKEPALQRLMKDVQKQYSDMRNIEAEIGLTFSALMKLLPGVEIPYIYTQVGALDQSIIVDGNTMGISLDKYMGSGYPLYLKYYTPEERKTMTSRYIAADCLSAYLLNRYPMPTYYKTQALIDHHYGKIQWIVNKVLSQPVYHSEQVDAIDQVMKTQDIKPEDLLKRPLI